MVGPEMSSLAYSPTLCTPKKHTTITCSTSSSSSLRLLLTKNISKVAQHLQAQDTAASLHVVSGKWQKLVGRREAVLVTGLLSAGLAGAQLAAASEEGSCEFTVAPSGLGFCDQVIGIGPQASQGQLIKVHSSFF